MGFHHYFLGIFWVNLNIPTRNKETIEIFSTVLSSRLFVVIEIFLDKVISMLFQNFIQELSLTN